MRLIQFNVCLNHHLHIFMLSYITYIVRFVCADVRSELVLNHHLHIFMLSYITYIVRFVCADVRSELVLQFPHSELKPSRTI